MSESDSGIIFDVTWKELEVLSQSKRYNGSLPAWLYMTEKELCQLLGEQRGKDLFRMAKSRTAIQLIPRKEV
jgi:hypothetical protein